MATNDTCFRFTFLVLNGVMDDSKRKSHFTGLFTRREHTVISGDILNFVGLFRSLKQRVFFVFDRHNN